MTHPLPFGHGQDWRQLAKLEPFTGPPLPSRLLAWLCGGFFLIPLFRLVVALVEAWARGQAPPDEALAARRQARRAKQAKRGPRKPLPPWTWKPLPQPPRPSFLALAAVDLVAMGTLAFLLWQRFFP